MSYTQFSSQFLVKPAFGTRNEMCPQKGLLDFQSLININRQFYYKTQESHAFPK